MAPQGQVGATMRVLSHMIIIAERNMWIIIDTLPPLRQGAHIIVPRRMNLPQGIGEIIIDILHLLHQGAMPKVHTHMSLHQGTPRIVIAMFHLLRLGAMTRVHMHMSLHQGTLRTITDIHPRGIAISIVHLMIVIDTAMVMPQGEQLHKRQGRHHMRRLPMVIHQDTRWWQVQLKRTVIIWGPPILMPTSWH